jgi:hypothetical protein
MFSDMFCTIRASKDASIQKQVCSPPLSSTAFARKSFTHALKVVIIVEETPKPEPAISAAVSSKHGRRAWF